MKPFYVMTMDRDYPHAKTLHEAIDADDAEALKGPWPHDTVYRVSAEKAHQWVREGGIHTTGLYLADNGRIRRRAAESYAGL